MVEHSPGLLYRHWHAASQGGLFLSPSCHASTSVLQMYLLSQAFYVSTFSVGLCVLCGSGGFAFICLCTPCKIFLCCFKSESVNHLGPGFGMLWPEYVAFLWFKKKGKIRRKCSLASIKLCNIVHQRAEFLVIQKTDGSCVLPNPVLGPRLGELVLHGRPRILHPDNSCSLVFLLPPRLTRRFFRYFGSEWCAIEVYPSCQSCLVVNWTLSCKPASVASPLE